MKYIIGIIAFISILGLIVLLIPLIKTRRKTSKNLREKNSENLTQLNRLIITIASAIIVLSVKMKVDESIDLNLNDVWISFLCCIVFGILAFFFDHIRKIYDELTISTFKRLGEEEDKGNKRLLSKEAKTLMKMQSIYQITGYCVMYLQFVTFISGMVFIISKGLRF
ncbi:hypothetical protein [Flagellimonas sp. 2504JD1-5]